MTRNATKTSYFFLSAFLFFALSCNNHKTSIPFPEAMERPQPVTNPLQFTEPVKLTWPEGKPVKPVVQKFDFNKLPSRPFDSSGFIPFSKPPEEVPFDFDKLPDTAFNYDKLPSKPLKFEISVLQRPQLIKTSLHLKTASPQPVYELGEPFTGKSIWSVFEDSKGFLWISDQQGLYRYDGENLLLYLPGWSAVSRSFAEDSKGQIWIATANSGIYVINQESAIVKHLTVSGGLISNNTGKAIIDKQDRIWVTCFPDNPEAWLGVIDEDQNTIKRFGFPQGLSGDVPLRIMQDDQNNIWISTNNGGVNIVDPKNGILKYLDKRSGLISNSTSKILQDETGRIWISDFYGAINAISIKAKTINHYSSEQGLAKSTWVMSMLSDGENICIATTTNDNVGLPGTGLCIFNLEKKQFKILNTISGLNSNDLYALQKDRRGQTWIATSKGLNMINRNGGIIEHAGNKNITSLAQDKQGRIWSGSENGIEIIDSATRTIRSLSTIHGLTNDSIETIRLIAAKICIMNNGGIDILDSNFTTITHLGKQQGLTFQRVTTFSKDERGMFWISNGINAEGGIDVYDPQKQTLQQLGVEQGMKDSAILDIVHDQKGNIWFTSFRLGFIDPGRKTVKYIKEGPGLNEVDVGKILLADNKGNVWIGTAKGIYMVNRSADSITRITVHEGLINDNIISLNQYKDHIYAGTKGGLTIITPPSLSSKKKWEFESFGSEQGIYKTTGSWEADMVTTSGRFLLGDAGITSLSDNKRFTPSPETEVTGIDIFNRPQYFSNQPWPSLNEKDTLRESNPDTFYVKDQLPSNIEFLKQGNIKYDSVDGSYNMPVNLSLPYYQNFLQFHFAPVHGDNQDTTWYRYTLEGADEKWSDRTFIPASKNYYSLPPGNYTFKVASLYNAEWTRPAEFSFIVLPPWWRTWWAYCLFALALFAIVYVTVQYRSRNLIAANLALEGKINERTAELKQSLHELRSTQAQLIQSEKMASLGELTAGIAHEIQNPLNFVNNFSEVSNEMIEELNEELDKGDIEEAKAIGNDIKQNLEKINHHGKRADAIVKGMLQHSKTSTGIKEPTDINKLADEYLRLSYHGMRAKDKSFNAEIKTDFDDSVDKINVVPQDIGRVLLNLFNNAFYAVMEKNKDLTGLKILSGQQAYEPTVTVSTKKIDDKISISVKDNGPGIPQNIVDKIFQPFFTTKPTGLGTGLGLSLTYDIVKANGGEIKVKTKEGEGSEFVIQLPVV
jgi:signal transduction histidine kinase/ligand-binding sensor domain-containing protein